jgi:ABC-type uncharacterized transport system permease subunit
VRPSFAQRIGVWRLQRGIEPSPEVEIIARLLSIALALVVAGVVIRLSGLEPLELGAKALRATVGSSSGLVQAATLATPLILTGLAVAVGMRMRLWNIGAEGQLFMGAWAATAVGLYVNGPAPWMLVVLLSAGALGGALWILVPAVVRAFWNVNEIITTLLLNFVAVLVVDYFAIGPWRDRKVGILSATYRVPYELPTFSNTSLHIGIVIAVLLAIGLALIIQNTRWGFEVRMVGGNRRAAEFAGIPVTRNIVLVMLLSGALAGVAGMIEVTGTAHRLSGTISNQYGFMGIIVAALANASPLLVIPAGFLLAVLLNAGIVLQTQGLSVNTMLAINGLILLFAAIGEVAAQYRLVRVGLEINREPLSVLENDEIISPVPNPEKSIGGS